MSEIMGQVRIPDASHRCYASPMSVPLEFYAITPIGFEQVAAAELADLTAHDIRTGHGGVSFSGTMDTLFRVSLRARTLTRILLRLGEFRADTFPELFNKSRRLKWSQYFQESHAIEVKAQCHASKLIHSGRVEETVLAAVCDKLGVQAGGKGAKQSIYARFENNICTISIDASGERLDRRGYRLESGKAPLRESIAAGLLRWSGWKADEALMAPMCGSGTFAIEAACMAEKNPAGLEHAFPFFTWHCFHEKTWLRVRDKALQMQQTCASVIAASDQSPDAVAISRRNAERAGVIGSIVFEQADIRNLQPCCETPGLLIMNPPYGARIGGDIRGLYAEIGKVFRERFQGWRMLVICPDSGSERALGLAAGSVLSFTTGGKQVRAVLIGKA